MMLFKLFNKIVQPIKLANDYWNWSLLVISIAFGPVMSIFGFYVFLETEAQICAKFFSVLRETLIIITCEKRCACP